MNQKGAIVAFVVLVLLGITLILHPTMGDLGHTGQVILSALLCTFLIWMLYQSIKRNPEAFSSKSLSRSAFTMGILALILIGVISFVVVLLK